MAAAILQLVLTPAAVIQVLTYYRYLLTAPPATLQAITVAIPPQHNHHHHLTSSCPWCPITIITRAAIILEAVQITADLQMTTVELVAIPAVEEEITVEAIVVEIILAIVAAAITVEIVTAVVAEIMAAIVIAAEEVAIMAVVAIVETNGNPLRWSMVNSYC
jgi:hypothetical protein